MNYRKFAPILFSNACTWHELVDLTLFGTSTHLPEQSPNGLKHVTDDWHFEFPTHITQVSIASLFMWAMRLNIVDEGYFLIQTLQRILKTQNQHQAEFSAFSGGRKSVPISWMCKKQTSVSHRAPQNQKSYHWMLVGVWMVYLRSTYGIWSLKC